MVRAKFTYSGHDASLMSREKRDSAGDAIKDENGRHVYEQVELRTLRFAPVYANNDPAHENSKFWRASPSGEVKLGTVNPEAWSKFVLGKEYYLDFTVAE